MGPVDLIKTVSRQELKIFYLFIIIVFLTAKVQVSF